MSDGVTTRHFQVVCLTAIRKTTSTITTAGPLSWSTIMQVSQNNNKQTSKTMLVSPSLDSVVRGNGKSGKDSLIPSSDFTADRQSSSDEADSSDEGCSSHEALMEMLGLTSFGSVMMEEDDECAEISPLQRVSTRTWEKIYSLVQTQNLFDQYASDGFCFFPSELSIPAALMRQLTDELVWGGDSVRSDRSYETVASITGGGERLERKTLTRLENFVRYHEGWKAIRDYITKCVSALLGKQMVLFKEKLNLKPPGGTGFAPHLDGPSLRVALGNEGPKTFVTIMIAIDNMTSQNGCLRICPGRWSEDHTCQVVAPEANGNPDAGGRAGAVPLEVADAMEFVDLACSGGSIAAFNEWAPHRSSPNLSPFSRRAVFLTYNDAKEGDFHELYYQRMDERRQRWRESIGLAQRQQMDEDRRLESDALATIPQ